MYDLILDRRNEELKLVDKFVQLLRVLLLTVTLKILIFTIV
jgi:hypothetical protein